MSIKSNQNQNGNQNQKSKYDEFTVFRLLILIKLVFLIITQWLRNFKLPIINN